MSSSFVQLSFLYNGYRFCHLVLSSYEPEIFKYFIFFDFYLLHFYDYCLLRR